ncbi:MAG TPA: FAD-dependent oxidoreductase [Bacillus bacterium]|nr:FAD-dependent oxidoreductase [Bacillus sp. (in: firmicutes)]
MYKKTIFVIIIISILTITGFSFLQKNNEIYAESKIDQSFFSNEHDIKTFDVIVIGGEPEGIAAAISAARNGSNTLLISDRDGIGGLFTYGKMNVLDFPRGIGNKVLSNGVFKEWHHMVGGKKSFEIKAAKNAFLKMVYHQENLSMLLHTKVKDIELKNDQEIGSIKILNNNKVYTVQAKKYIDATQDADVAYSSGVPYFIGAEDVGYSNRQMAVTLMIHLKDVNWSKIKETAKTETFGPAEVTLEAAWGFPKLRDMYKPHDSNMRLRGLNLIRNREGYYINALQIFGVDGLSKESIQAGIERGKKETVFIVDWLKENFPGFENAKIASYPTELYVRETRHIRSLYQLPVSDLWENKYHWDTIAYGGYPSDIQATSRDDAGAIVVNPTQYSIPFRSIVSQKITNLLVVGRSSGYSSLAQGSARIVPTGMATGEGAGVASAIAIKYNMNFHEMAKHKKAISELQLALTAQGAKVEKFTLPFPYEEKWYYPAIRELLNHRALFGGYTNDLLENEIAQNKSFSNILLHMYIAKRNNDPNFEKNIHYLRKYFTSKETSDLTIEEINAIIEGLPYKDFTNAYKKELEKMKDKKSLTREDVYIIVGKIFEWI